MIFLYIVLGIILLYLILCFIIFFVTLYKVRIKQIEKGIELAIVPFKDFITKSKEFYDNVPKKDIYIKSFDNLKLHASFIECKNAIGTIVLLHGYKSNAKNDLSTSIEEYLKLKLNVITVDNRSTSLSKGNWTTFGILESKDAALWIDYAIKKYKLPVILGGISMGAATSLFLLPNIKNKVAFVIADSAYVSPYDQMCTTIDNYTFLKGKLFMPCVNMYSKLFLKVNLKQSIIDLYKDINLPVIFIHGMKDSFVPFECGKKLYDNYSGPKELLVGEEADHGMTYYYKKDEYIGLIKKFIKKYIK